MQIEQQQQNIDMTLLTTHGTVFTFHCFFKGRWHAAVCDERVFVYTVPKLWHIGHFRNSVALKLKQLKLFQLS